MGEDYTGQSRSEVDWYNPHLYNYYRGFLQKPSLVSGVDFYHETFPYAACRQAHSQIKEKKEYTHSFFYSVPVS